MGRSVATERPARFWEQQVRDLYVRTDMQADEFERLLNTALRGDRPDHSLLPAYAPFETEVNRQVAPRPGDPDEEF